MMVPAQFLPLCRILHETNTLPYTDKGPDGRWVVDLDKVEIENPKQRFM